MEGKNKETPPVATPDMCIFCFDVLYNYLHRIAEQPIPTFPDGEYPLFVTWKIQSQRRILSHGHDYTLRGCIGTFTPQRLYIGLREYSMTSAINDHRFSPITKSELAKLQCTVSLLIDFEPGSNYLDWEIGEHGIWIEFRNGEGRKLTGTYLPEVAHEQGWSKQKTVDSLLRKAGYEGHIGQALRDSIRLTRYKSQKVSITYAEYISLKHLGRVTHVADEGELVVVQA